MGRDLRSRKRQTQLSFTPLAVSSPLADELSQSVQNRAANVRYSNSPLRSKRGTRNTSNRNIEGFFAVASSLTAERGEALSLPTPDPSSQVDGPVSALDVASDFAGGSDITSDSDNSVQPSKSQVNQRSAARTPKRNATAFFSQAVSPPSKAPSPTKSPAKSNRKSSTSLFKSGSHRKAGKADTKIIDKDEDDEEDEEQVLSSRPRRSRNTTVVISSEEEDSDDSLILSESPKRRSHASTLTATPSKVSKFSKPVVLSDDEGNGEGEVGNEDDEDDDIKAPKSARRTRVRELVDDDSDDDDIVSPTKRRRGAVTESEEEGEDPQYSKKHLQEAEDLAEDLDFLKDSSPPPVWAEQKISLREKRRMNLEKMKTLREKKLGPNTAGQSSNQSDESEDAGEDELYENPFLEGRDPNEYDDDFVDDEGPQIEPSDIQLPLQFSGLANAPAKEHFKFVVEWMVHSKINPAFARDDNLYRLAFRKVDDEASAYSNSKLMSSAWKPDFSRALRARPIFTEMQLGKAFLQPHCGACGRTSHPATFRVTFSGKAYDQRTLENLKEEDASDDSSDDSEEDKDAYSVDVDGNELLPEDYEFFLGKFCKANSARAHALLHWKWHLNDWILDWLEKKGYTSAEHVVERENWSVKKRSKFANKIVDEMAGQEIKNLWRDFKGQLGEAKGQKLYR